MNPFLFQQLCLIGLEVSSEIAIGMLDEGFRLHKTGTMAYQELKPITHSVLPFPWGGNKTRPNEFHFSLAPVIAFRRAA
ncbi:MAG: hypothetical protein K9M10_03870 [Candidatus Pacebacteria bacterium]|nr:hypothetical protein [Candidatus Paceibacterota bacterium]MCF7857588.1 hypothetical protein [Candidatus Paceibacterota bacterium]